MTDENKRKIGEPRTHRCKCAIAYNPYTWREFMAAMRAAGWKNMGDGHGVFEHTGTGYKFQSFGYDDEYNEQWRRYAKERQTPPPF